MVLKHVMVSNLIPIMPKAGMRKMLVYKLATEYIEWIFGFIIQFISILIVINQIIKLFLGKLSNGIMQK